MYGFYTISSSAKQRRGEEREGKSWGKSNGCLTNIEGCQKSSCCFPKIEV
jgi:hypothetical protein